MSKFSYATHISSYTQLADPKTKKLLNAKEYQNALTAAAAAGDPYALASLGKMLYDQGKKEAAFEYFEAAIQVKEDKELTRQVATLIGRALTAKEDRELRLKYYCHAIERGDVRALGECTYMFPNLFEKIAYCAAQTSFLTGDSRAYPGSKTIYAEFFHDIHHADPTKFKEFFIAHPHASIKRALGNNSGDNTTVNNFKEKYRDQLVVDLIKYMNEDNHLKPMDEAIQAFKKENRYHDEYFIGIEELIQQREREIETVIAPDILSNLENFAIKQKELLLTAMRNNLLKNKITIASEHKDDDAFLSHLLGQFTEETSAEDVNNYKEWNG